MMFSKELRDVFEEVTWCLRRSYVKSFRYEKYFVELDMISLASIVSCSRLPLRL